MLTPAAKAGLDEWESNGNKKVIQRIHDLVESVQRTPFKGIGKPEPLK
jgi:toxin YoeB